MKKVNSKQWVVIAKEYGVSLFPIFLLSDSVYHGIKKYISQGAQVGLVLENRANTYIYLSDTWKKCHQLFIKKVKKDPKFLKNIFSEIETLGKQLVHYSMDINNKNLGKFSNLQLNSFYQQYISIARKIYSAGLVLPFLDFQETTFISDELNKFLSSKVGKKKQKEYFHILTTPIKFSSEKLQEIDLLKIFSSIKKSKKAQKALTTESNEKIFASLPKSIQEKLKNHEKKYAWTLFLFEGPPADISYFIDILKDFKRRRINPDKELNFIKSEQKNIINKQKKYLNELQPDPYYEMIISSAPGFGYWKVRRKEDQFKSYYYIQSLFKEIAKRLHLTVQQLRFMHPDEIDIALKTDEVDINLLNQRKQITVYFNQAKKYKILTGDKAYKFIKENVKFTKAKKNIKELKGSTACSGKAKGTVKVVNMVEDMEKFNQGDVLVSSATNPNLMPAIRKAAAILTDEGGLTCHAAIVSREFNIPCVVGLSIVTNVLKDGDRVEVDASKGIIRKI